MNILTLTAQGCLVNQEVSCISVRQHQHKANLIAAVPGDPQGLSSCSKKCLLRVRGICFSFTLEKAALLTPPNNKWIQYPLEIPILVRRGSVYWCYPAHSVPYSWTWISKPDCNHLPRTQQTDSLTFLPHMCLALPINLMLWYTHKPLQRIFFLSCVDEQSWTSITKLNSMGANQALRSFRQ